MTRSTRTLTLTALAGLAAAAHAQPSFFGIPFAQDMLERRPIGIFGGSDTPTICYKAINEKSVQHGVQIVETAGMWSGGEFLEMPQPVGDDGLFQDVVSYQFRPSPGRAQTIPGVDIIIKKTPSPQAAVWDTRGGGDGVVIDLENSYGAASWSTNASADASVIGGALLFDLDGQGVSRHAARWNDFGMAELMPEPVGIRASEVWATSDDGTLFLGAISEQGMPSDQPKMKPATSNKGIIWTDTGFTVVDASTAGPGAVGLALTAISADNSTALAGVAFDGLGHKGGIYNIGTGGFDLLDAGDVNGDGAINLFDTHESEAYALSGDGSVTLLGGTEAAALWISDGSQFVAHNAAAYLAGLGVTGLDGWTLGAVTAVSADGAMITGWGTDSQGRTGAGWPSSPRRVRWPCSRWAASRSGSAGEGETPPDRTPAQITSPAEKSIRLGFSYHS